MNDRKTKKLVLSALMAALVYVSTSIIQIPSPATNGYVNLGDCFVLLSGWLLGPWYGAAAAGIGSMLVDLLGSYAHYAPGTLVIKAADAMAAALIFRAMGRGKTGMLVSGVVDTSVGPVMRKSNAKIFAETSRSLEVSVPLKETKLLPDGYRILRPTFHLFQFGIPLYTDGPLEGEFQLVEKPHFLTAKGLQLPLGIVNQYYHRLVPTEINRTEEEAAALARQLLVTNAAFYIPLLGVNLFRFTIQGLGYSNLAVIAGVSEMIARGAVAALVSVFGFTAVCYASPAAWVLADCFLIPAYFVCMKHRTKEAAAVRK